MNRLRLFFFPPTATRAERIMGTLSTVLFFIAIASVILGCLFLKSRVRSAHTASVSPAFKFNLIVLGLSAVFAPTVAGYAGVVVQLILRRRGKRLIQQLDFRLCPRCRYDLSALDRARSARTRTGTCPECGHAFNIDDIRRYWRTDLGYSRSPRRR